jgi:mRNA-degrading endonuclease RelE of RelBE toxin-antitoxin system
MSDKISKFLRRLSTVDKARIDSVIERIMVNDLFELDIKKIVGKEKIFRARIGRVRIIFENVDKKHNKILRVSWRDDQTYRDY